MKVRKKTGEKQKFEREKVVEACMNCGALPEEAEEVADQVEQEIKGKEIISSDKIAEIVREELRERNEEAGEMYAIYGRD